jgi:hypothetical protein
MALILERENVAEKRQNRQKNQGFKSIFPGAKTPLESRLY